MQCFARAGACWVGVTTRCNMATMLSGLPLLGAASVAAGQNGMLQRCSNITWGNCSVVRPPTGGRPRKLFSQGEWWSHMATEPGWGSACIYRGPISRTCCHAPHYCEAGGSVLNAEHVHSHMTSCISILLTTWLVRVDDMIGTCWSHDWWMLITWLLLFQ